MQSDSPIMSLDRDLRGALVNRRTHSYIPINKQHELITPQKICEVMAIANNGSHSHSLQHIVNDIYQGRKIEDRIAQDQNTDTSRRKLFAILVMIHKPEEILSFIEEGICDTHLPFKRISQLKEGKHEQTLEINQVPKTKYLDNHKWKAYELLLFNVYQWYFLAPFFKFESIQMEHHKLTRDTPLPFTLSEEGSGSNTRKHYVGGFGDVQKIHIHPAHYDSAVRCNAVTVAILRLTACSQNPIFMP